MHETEHSWKIDGGFIIRAEGYTTTVVGDKGGIEDNKTDTAAFTNSKSRNDAPRTGTLVISKTIAGNQASKDEEMKRTFEFTVDIGENRVGYYYVGTGVANGMIRLSWMIRFEVPSPTTNSNCRTVILSILMMKRSHLEKWNFFTRPYSRACRPLNHQQRESERPRRLHQPSPKRMIKPPLVY